MGKGLTEAQIEQFRERGYVKNLRVWDEATIDRARRHFQRVTGELAALGLTHNDVNGWWAVNRGYWELCRTPAVLDCLRTCSARTCSSGAASTSTRPRGTAARCPGTRTPPTGP